ncbi:MAG: helix-turn-helix domain-containing protein [Rhodococcus sp. (in: high G+C Gram-positive bacteria)]|nr:helix-turn-helix domain-containing protein [Rhodococcus sp. (in: high G+C Gram-positive bacteria)]
MPTSPNDSLSRSAFRAITEVNDGSPVSDVAERFGVSRQTVTAWRKRYENSGIDGLVDSSRRPHASPNRIQPDIEALICEMRRHHRRWGARRICFELSKEIGDRTPSRATVHRTLVRNGLVNHQEQQHKRVYKRWQREAPMHLWQLGVGERAGGRRGRGGAFAAQGGCRSGTTDNGKNR